MLCDGEIRVALKKQRKAAAQVKCAKRAYIVAKRACNTAEDELLEACKNRKSFTGTSVDAALDYSDDVECRHNIMERLARASLVRAEDIANPDNAWKFKSDVIMADGAERPPCSRSMCYYKTRPFDKYTGFYQSRYDHSVKICDRDMKQEYAASTALTAYATTQETLEIIVFNEHNWLYADETVSAAFERASKFSEWRDVSAVNGFEDFMTTVACMHRSSDCSGTPKYLLVGQPEFACCEAHMPLSDCAN